MVAGQFQVFESDDIGLNGPLHDWVVPPNHHFSLSLLLPAGGCHNEVLNLQVEDDL